jgi:lipoprotein-releasing system ATP-binding protein
MSENLIEAENLSRVLVSEITTTLVRDANVVIKPGEFVVITGPSGSGKSSLLYLLGLLDTPTTGHVSVNGTNTSILNSDKLARFRLENMGFVFQFHFLLPEFTAIENVMLPMRKLGKLSEKNIREKAEATLARLGIGDQLHKLPKQMSGGQCQRVAVARALGNDPLLILADEPTGNLDTVSSKTVQTMFREIAHSENRAVLAVTHDIEFASLADRIIRLVDGRITDSDYKGAH